MVMRAVLAQLLIRAASVPFVLFIHSTAAAAAAAAIVVAQQPSNSRALVIIARVAAARSQHVVLESKTDV